MKEQWEQFAGFSRDEQFRKAPRLGTLYEAGRGSAGNDARRRTEPILRPAALCLDR